MGRKTVICHNCGGNGYGPSPNSTGNIRCIACGGAGYVVEDTPTEPRKTWLDECAMMAMQAVLSNSVFETFRQKLDKTVSEERQKKAIAEMCYCYAEAMLAEKMKREAKE